MAEGDVTRINAEGAVVLPQALREELGLVPGAEVSIELRGQTIFIEKSLSAEDRRQQLEDWLDRLAGSADHGMTTDEVMALTRGEE